MDILQVKNIFDTDPRHARASFDRAYERGSAFTQGEYRPIGEAMVPIQDAGFIHADAAYDVVTASAGYMFRMDDHIARFNESCTKFLLTNPYSDEETIEILNNLVTLTGLQDAYVWWAVTRGEMQGTRDNPTFINKFYAYVTPYVFVMGDDVRTRGGNIAITRDIQRIPPEAVDPTAKNLHWMDMTLSLIGGLVGGADWSVLLDRNGNLTEAPGCNIFVVADGTLRTPARGCLEGITRRTVTELAGELGVGVDIGTVPAEELETADEAFLTSSAGGIMPITHVDGHPLKAGSTPGPITRELHNRYWTKRWNGWLGDKITYNT
ncbi:MAG: aminotransferase class IV [Acidimicrobiales bacterium]